MRRAGLVGVSLGVLLASGACATATMATQGQGQLDEAVPQSVSRTLSASERDSVFAQAYADREGPHGWIYADANSASGGRLVQASFHLDDDAYVVIGHLDADGVLRIVFPRNPGDDGFVRGDKSYLTDEFFAGFTDEYRYRAQEVSLMRGPAPKMDSYDGGLGYVFMIASWRPMRFDEFSSGGIWNRYELTDDEYIRDPRAAIQELASVLTGDNREAFTVQYARYYSTISSLGNVGDSFDSGYCSGFNSVGLSSGLFGFNSMLAGFNSLNLGYGSGGCFSAGSYGFTNYGLGYGILPPVRVIPRATVAVRPHPTPQPVPRHHFQNGIKNDSPNNGAQAGGSPEYRRRGLITSDDGSRSGPEHNAPRASAHMRTEQPARPGIEQMINRRHEYGASDGNMPRAHDRMDHDRSSQDGNVARPVPAERQSRPAPANRTHPEARTAEPRSAQPRENRPRVEQAPRVDSPRPANPPSASTARPSASTPTPSRP